MIRFHVTFINPCQLDESCFFVNSYIVVMGDKSVLAWN